MSSRRRPASTEALTLRAICWPPSGAGDARVVEVVLEAGAYLGRMLGHLVGALDIHDIVLIGSMTAFGEPWLDAVRVAAQGSALPLLVDETRIGIGRLGSDVVELGAAALLMTVRARPEPGGMTMPCRPCHPDAESRPLDPAIDTTDDGLILGIDIGGTKTAAIVVDATDQVLGRAERADRSTVAGGGHQSSVARTAMSQLDGAAERLRAVGVARARRRRLAHRHGALAVNLDARDLPLGELLGAGPGRALLRGARCPGRRGLAGRPRRRSAWTWPT